MKKLCKNVLFIEIHWYLSVKTQHMIGGQNTDQPTMKHYEFPFVQLILCIDCQIGLSGQLTKDTSFLYEDREV